VDVLYQAHQVSYRVRDQGPGFSPEGLPRGSPQEPLALHGRGLMLMRHFMDDVRWNATGNEVTLVLDLSARAKTTPQPPGGSRAGGQG
jgi:anti-sigma regulatory factor (Ser/Thr protein kinase)